MNSDEKQYQQAVRQATACLGSLKKRNETEGLKVSEVLNEILEELILYVPKEEQAGLLEIYKQGK